VSVVTNQLRCDACGVESSATGGWLVALTPSVSDEPSLKGIAFGTIEAADLGFDNSIKVEHICSHACAVKRFSQWLGTL
jgi:hypothetical protein